MIITFEKTNVRFLVYTFLCTVCVWVFVCIDVNTPCACSEGPQGPEDDIGSPGTGVTDRSLWASMWMLGIKLGSAATAPNLQAISPPLWSLTETAHSLSVRWDTVWYSQVCSCHLETKLNLKVLVVTSGIRAESLPCAKFRKFLEFPRKAPKEQRNMVPNNFCSQCCLFFTTTDSAQQTPA